MMRNQDLLITINQSFVIEEDEERKDGGPGGNNRIVRGTMCICRKPYDSKLSHVHWFSVFHPSSLIIFTTFATFLLLSPFAFFLERSKWPKKFTIKLLIQLVLISFGGVTLFQTLLLRGIKLTSPATATAMPNLAPAFIFLIAWAFGIEKVQLNCKYSKFKIWGTLLCVMGAILMSIMHSKVYNDHFETNPTLINSLFVVPPHHKTFDEDKIIGCLYLIAAVIVLSSVIVLQASILVAYPVPISLCAITSVIGVVITGVLQVIQEHRIETGWPLLSIQFLIAYSLLAGSISGICVSFSGWAMKKKGPVLVSMFNPVGTVFSLILSFFLGHSIHFGSILGMLVMFVGLYLVVWARGKEDILDETQFDAEKPLLS